MASKTLRAAGDVLVFAAAFVAVFADGALALTGALVCVALIAPSLAAALMARGF